MSEDRLFPQLVVSVTKGRHTVKWKMIFFFVLLFKITRVIIEIIGYSSCRLGTALFRINACLSNISCYRTAIWKKLIRKISCYRIAIRLKHISYHLSIEYIWFLIVLRWEITFHVYNLLLWWASDLLSFFTIQKFFHDLSQLSVSLNLIYNV